MKKIIINYHSLLVLSLFFLLTCSFSCKKKTDPHVPPKVVFKEGLGYTSGDKIINKNDTVLVGITATKTEDDLKSYNASVAYDGATTTNTFYNYILNSSEINSYSKDLNLIARNKTGTEKWIFSIVDRDGNITQKTIVLTVQ